MDYTLRCNILKCRTELTGHAVVTTCSHVFCIDCANHCQLNAARDGQFSVCPACEGQLRAPDDVVMTNLNPTEDYKTSVLSGLSPNIIMECAGRALSWWAYQATQEEFLAKNLGEKYSSLNLQMDKIVHNANSEISNLRNQMSNLLTEKDSLRQKNEELSQAFREKSRKHMQTQEMFDKMKRRNMLGQVQNAASVAVEHTIQASATASRYVDTVGDQNQGVPPSPFFADQQPANVHNQGSGTTNMAPPGFLPTNRESWTGFGSQGSTQHNQPVQAASTHRQALQNTNLQATPRQMIPNYQANSLAGTPMPLKPPSPRIALASISGNASSGSAFAGYGMSAGLKVSNPMGPPGGNRPSIRSRGLHGRDVQFGLPANTRAVAPRPTSGFQGNRDGTFRPPPTANMFNNGSGFY